MPLSTKTNDYEGLLDCNTISPIKMGEKLVLFLLSALAIFMEGESQTLKSLRFKKVIVEGTLLLQVPSAPGVT